MQCRLRELHTLKGKVESFAKLRGLDVDHVNAHYTVWVVSLLFTCDSLSMHIPIQIDELKGGHFYELSIKSCKSVIICCAFFACIVPVEKNKIIFCCILNCNLIRISLFELPFFISLDDLVNILLWYLNLQIHNSTTYSEHSIILYSYFLNLKKLGFIFYTS